MQATIDHSNAEKKATTVIRLSDMSAVAQHHNIDVLWARWYLVAVVQQVLHHGKNLLATVHAHGFRFFDARTSFSVSLLCFLGAYSVVVTPAGGNHCTGLVENKS